MTIWPRLALVVAVAGALIAGGYMRGRSDCAAAHQAQLLAQIEAGQKLDAARRQVAQERDALARQLEEEAYADPVAVDRCLSPGRVQRLNRLR